MEESTPLTFDLCSSSPNEAKVSATLSADVLVTICGELEFVSTTEDVVMLKHEKNRIIFALSNVCRSWRHHITGCKYLFRDIAFDASSEESIVTAGVFLKMLEGTGAPISVYANLRQPSRPNPMVTRLFARLRPHIPHIVHFEYNGDMAEYRLHLDHPAPNLLFFSDGFDARPGSGLPLFRGHMPGLRVLTTLSPASQVVWTTSTLLDLTILNLGFLGMGPSVHLGPLLDLLRGSPRLESVIILCFAPVVNPNEALPDVFLPRLHTLGLQHNEFHTVLKHLRIPNVREVFFHGESHPVSGEELNPTFKAPHLFAGFPLLPIFEQPIENLRLETTADGRTYAKFCIRLTADGGFVLRVSLYWVLDAVPLFKDYLKHSVTWLARMVSLTPQAHVELFLAHEAPLDTLTYQPFLLVADIGDLTIRGGFAVDVLNKLTTRTGSQHLLPHLKLLNIMDRVQFSDEEGKGALLACLRSRVAGPVRLSVRLMCTEVPCMDSSGLGYVFKRDVDDTRFLLITFDPNSVVSGI